ncbi:glycosyltransferase family 4 protein [Schleiferiaceae bacterium]|nr:glycosyltransferase family 4 protein [Schleiferiaceae bacterium]
MKILVISKYTTLPKYSKLPSRWYYLKKEFEANGSSVSVLIGSYNHLNTREVTSDDLVAYPGFEVIRSPYYRKTASFSRVYSWLVFEIGVLKYYFRSSEKYDVVIASSLSILSIISALIYKVFNRNVKVVFEVRDIWPLTLLEESSMSKFHPFAMFLVLVEWIGITYSDLCVGTMPGLGLYLSENFGTMNKEAFISPLGIDSDRLKQLALLDTYSDGGKGSDFIVGYAGSIGTTNALDTFMNVILLSGKRGLPIRYKIYGEGDMLDYYKSYLSEMTNVEFHNKVPHDVIGEKLWNCDLLYLATHKSGIWKYGQSMNKVVDYMLLGKPIVASYSGLETMINESGCGEFHEDKGAEDLLKVFLRFSQKSTIELKEMGMLGREWLKAHRLYKDLSRQYHKKLISIL